MKKIYSLLFALVSFTTAVFAQPSNYIFAGSTGSYTAITGTDLGAAAQGDDVAVGNLTIGFPFVYNGTTFNVFAAASNGFIELGSTLTYANNTAAGWTPSTNALTGRANVIAGLWDDNNTTGSTIIYSTTGSSPNRVLTVQWTGVHIGGGGSSTNPTINMQILLYETSNRIQVIYGTTSAAFTSTTASIGLSGNVGNFLSVTPTATTTPYGTTSNITENTSISASTFFPTGTTYTFTPPPPCTTPSSVAASVNVTPGVNTAAGSFTAAPAAPSGYLVVRTTTNTQPVPVDGTSYTAGSNAIGYIEYVNAAPGSFTSTGLVSGTTYYYWVFSYNTTSCTGGPLYSISATSTVASTGACSIGGVKSVGPGGDYATLKAAADALVLNGITAPVILELNAAYSNTTDATFPIVLGNVPCASPSNTITVRPAAGAGAKTITSSNTTATIDINGGSYWIIDGRQGGTGSSKSLTISNTSAATGGAAVRFINDAVSNTINYVAVTASYSSASSGIISFSTTTGITGNDNNTISNSDIDGGAGATASPTATVINGIYSSGSTTTTVLNNSGNTVLGCNIFNVFNAATGSNGISLSSGNTDWTINNNNFYQTAVRTSTASGTYSAISVSNTSGNNFTVNGNMIGGSAANAAGAAWTFSNTTFTNRFIGISLSVGTTAASNIQGNTVANFAVGTNSTATTGNGNFSGISVTAGNANIGTIAGNTIGSGTSTGSITITASATSGTANMISYSGSGIVDIRNNAIGSINLLGTSATISQGINGIYVSGGTPTVSNNIIGSLSTPNSINSSTATTAGTQALSGIQVTSGVTVANAISGNTIANITGASTFTSAIVRGIIYNGTGFCTISQNIVHDISSASANTTVAGGATAVQGILYTGTSPLGGIVSQNTVYTIKATNSGTVATASSGIGYSNATAGTVNANRIYDIQNASTGTTATAPPLAIGLLIRAAVTSGTFSNNMISLGTGQTTNTEFVGIMNSFTTGTISIHYNSINIAGTAGTGSLPSFSFLRGDNSGTAITTQVDIKNNIFINQRTGGTGKHYAIANQSTAASTTGWGTNASNFNVLNATAATIGLWGATDQTFAAWKSVSAGDGSSLSGISIVFAGVATADLHINMGTTPTPLESGGTSVATVTDFDNQSRPGPTGSSNGGGAASDIGADEFDGVGSDLTAPSVTYTTLVSTACLTDRTLTATITDASGVNILSGTRPRLYFKKASNANTYNNNTNATDGWKYVEATGAGGSPFNFTTNYALLNGGVTGGDFIQYFVVAQDNAGTPNVAINIGTFAANPTTVSLTAAAFPLTGTINQYTLIPTLSSDVTIGATGTYTSLTGTSGLFAAINAGGLSANINAKIIDASITESGVVALNQITYGCAGLYTLTIKPDVGVNAVLTGAFPAASTIKLNGADNVIIDGSNNGTASRNLTIQNTTTTTSGNAVIWLASPAAGNGANNNIIKNTIIEGNAATTTFMGMYVGGTTSITTTATGLEANNSNTITNNLFRKTQYGLVMFGYSATSPDLNNVISNNSFGTTTTGEGFSLEGIHTDREQNVTVSGNEVQNIVVTGSSTAFGIRLLDFKNGLCFNNKVHDILYTGSSTAKVYGIAVTSSTFATSANPSQGQIYNNIVYKLNSSATSSTWNTTGILAGQGYGDKYYYNTVSLTGQLANSSAGLAAAFANGDGNLPTVGTNIDVRNNIFSVTGSSSTAGGNFWATYSLATTLAGSTLNYNDLYCNGTGATNNVGRFNGTNSTTLAAWQTSTGMEANSITSDPSLNSPSNLILNAGSPAIGAGNNAGTGITTDIVGSVRSNGTPPAGSSMGAYENAGDFAGPVITYTAIANTSCTTQPTFNATITDVSGVNIASGTRPRLYYKKSTNTNTYNGNTSTTDGWKYVEAAGAGGSPFSFTFDYSLLNGGFTSGTIQYFVVAQDNVATPNVGINNGTFTVNPASVSLTATAFPLTGTINQYTLSPSLSADVTIGASGTYTSLTGVSGLFAAINAGGLSANINAKIIDASVTETGTVALNQITYGCAGLYTLTIKPDAGVNAVVTGSMNAGATIKLNGADNVIIDGSNNGTNSRNLTIQNTTTTTSGNAVIWIAAPALGNGANNNIIKNTVIEGNTATTTFMGMYVGGSTSITTIASGFEANNTNLITNNLFRKTQYGLVMFGYSAASPDLNNVVSNNSFGTATTGEGFSLEGIHTDREQNIIISGNEIQNITNATTTTNMFGIRLLDFKNGSCYNNRIHDISYTGTSTGRVYGIGVTSSTFTTSANPSQGQVYNNFVYKLNSTATNIWNVTGILAGQGYGDKYYYNSVNLTGQLSNSSSGGAAAFAIGDANLTTVGTNVDVRNNIFSLTGSSTTAGGNFWAVYTPATTLTGSVLNYNDLYCNGTGVTNNVGRFNGTNYTTLAAWQAATAMEANSVAGNPQFNSATDLHINPAAGTPVESAATPIAGIGSDIDGDARNGSTPDMGADEGNFTPAVTNDAQATAFIDPVNGATKSANTPFTPIASFTNNGTVTQSNVPVRYRIVGPSPSTAEVYNQTGTITSLPSFATANFSFPAATITAAGVYTIYAKAELAGDGVPANDQITGTLNVEAPLCGIYAVGASQPAGFQNLTQAVGKLNTLGASCRVTFELQSDYSSTGETYPISINVYPGMSSSNSFTVKPAAGVTSTISGSLASNALIKINGASFVTIDGSNNASTTQNLTINNTATTAPSGVSVVSLGLGAGSTNSTIKNCLITTGVATSLGYGVSIGGGTPGTAGADNDNITIQNNAITAAPVGIYASGTTAVSAGADDNLLITNNTITYNSSLASIGIQAANSLTSLIRKNTVSEQTSSSQAPTGISVEGGYINSSVSANNIIKSLTTNTSGYGGRGITVGTGNATSNLTIDNNFVSGVNGSDFSSFTNSSSMGIVIGTVGSSSTLTTSAGGINLLYNTVSMSGAIGAGSTSAITTAIYIGSGATAMDLRNNIFSNTMTGVNTGQKNYAIYSAVANTAYTRIDYNDYYVANSFNAASAVLGYLGGDQATPTALATAFGQNTNSQNGQATFISASDLHLVTPNTNNFNFLESKGTVVAVTTDYDADARPNGTAPDIGADEFVGAIPSCAGATTVAVVSGSLTPTSASISWTGAGTFLLEYGPSGFTPGTAATAGTNGTVLNPAVSPQAMAGLSGNTIYDVYIRQICSGPTYSLNSPVITFTTPISNDDAPGALTLTLGAGCTGNPYTLVGATASANEVFPSCSGSVITPVWFKFVAPASGAVRVSTDNAPSGTLTDTRIGLFSAGNANDYSTFNIIACDEDGGSLINSGFMSVMYSTGLTPGATYYVAVDKFGTSTSAGTFCVTVDELNSSMLSTTNTCTSTYQTPFNGSITNYKGWISLLDANSKLVALVRKPTTGTAENLFVPSQNINTGAVRQTGGVYYLNRNFRIASTETNVDVQFFFLNTELNSLIAQDPGAVLGNIGGAKQTDAGGCQNNFATANGAYTLFSQTGNGTVNGLSWITTNVASFSNFYLYNVNRLLPVTIDYFKGAKIAAGNYLNWKVTCTSTPSVQLVLERSNDGRSFKPIQDQTATALRCQQEFNYTDASPLSGMNYYRLKIITPDGAFRYSVIVALINKDKGFEFVNIAPNPVKNTATLTLTTVKGGKMDLAVTDITGKMVMQQSVITTGGNNTINMNFSTLGAGTYQITGIAPDGEKKTIRFVKL